MSAFPTFTPLVHLTLQKIIPTSPRMRNQPRQLILPIKHDSIRPWAAPGINFIRAQNRELVVRSCDREAEAFVIVVDVRIVAAAERLPGLLERVAFGLGGRDVGGPVANCATGVDAGLTAV